MFKNSKLQVFSVLAMGALLGYAAANSNSLERPAQASLHELAPTVPASASPRASVGLVQCAPDDGRTLFLAQADIQVAQAQPNRTQAGAGAASGKKPNILFIMGDDIGWFQIGAYHRGMMSGKTPNLDKLASQGMIFTDYYAEASCTAGRANFITGELPLRTGLTTVGQAGADVGIPAQACTLATALKAQGYATGQFGKNHLGDLNKYLPTLHGFDEFFGYLYHLDAMSDPYWYSFPNDQAYRDKYGPRHLV